MTFVQMQRMNVERSGMKLNTCYHPLSINRRKTNNASFISSLYIGKIIFEPLMFYFVNFPGEASRYRIPIFVGIMSSSKINDFVRYESMLSNIFTRCVHVRLGPIPEYLSFIPTPVKKSFVIQSGNAGQF